MLCYDRFNCPPRSPVTHRHRLLLLLSALLVAGFLTISLGSYWAFRDAVRQSISEDVLPLTGDTIYYEMQKDILRPIFISSVMADDVFLRDWLLGGEKDIPQIVRFLTAIKDRYGAQTSFLVSERSGNYYFIGGLLKQVREDEPRDAWFYRVRKMQQPYELNLDPDAANHDSPTIFINYRVLDYDGKFIAAVGVGLPMESVMKQIRDYETRFHRRIYFVDRGGKVVLSGRPELSENIGKQEGIAAIAPQILAGSAAPLQSEYRRDGSDILVNARLIPELGWHLIVEEADARMVRPVRRVLAGSLAVSALVTLLVLGLAVDAVNRYQRRLERVAATDPLTGMLNRQAFDFIFGVALRECQRNGQPLSVILFDIDLFKQVNDTHGHLAGDNVLRTIADVTRRQLREADVVARWGGEEFLVLLKDCPLANALAVAEKLRAAIAGYRFGIAAGDARITVSLGVAEYTPGDTVDKLFNRADSALYLAKRNGRNRIEAAQA